MDRRNVARVGPSDDNPAGVRRVIAYEGEYIRKGFEPEDALETFGAILDPGAPDTIRKTPNNHPTIARRKCL